MQQIPDNFHSIKDLEVTENYPLSLITGFKTGGPCILAEPLTEQAFAECLITLRNDKIPFRVLGNGTNTIARDDGYDGVVIRTQKCLKELKINDTSVYASAGLSLSTVCRAAAEAGLSGLEFAYGIPGSIGGAVYMNAGAYGGEIKDVIKSARVLDLNENDIREIPVNELKLGYRDSIFHRNRDLVVLGASFELKISEKDTIWEMMNELMGRRLDKQPLEYPSCGSTFKRPEGAYAGKLIQDCGLKGYRVGGAAVSEKHAGFVVNLGGAVSNDIFNVIKHVQNTVLNETGYYLACEVEVLE